MEQKLYIKNDKGRYEPYKEPEPPFNNMLYRKFVHNGKVTYDPMSMHLRDETLGEGVWVVTKHVYGRSIMRGSYLRDMFMCEKASDIQDVSLAKLGGLDKLADYLAHHWDEIPEGRSTYDTCRAIVGILFDYENKDKDL